MKNTSIKRISGLITLIVLLSVCLPITNVCAQKSKNKSKEKQSITTTGKQDREYWSELLYKMSYPVIHNLAEETLKKNMPLETGPDYYLQVKKVTYLEAVGRTMAGIAPWLALPDDNTKEGVMRKTLRDDLLKGLTHAVDPNSADYLNFRSEHQPIVDAAYMAQAFLRAPKALWEPLDAVTKKRIVEEFKALRNRSAAYNNWLLFAGINEAFLLSIGEEPDPARIDFAKKKIIEWYEGDGWYSDGPNFSMDYYNSYVIHPMLIDFYKVLLDKNKIKKEEYDTALKRMVRYTEFLERIIGPDGSYPPFGRSITYRTGAFQALAQTALMEKLPEHVPPAQVRSGLTAVMHRMYDQCNNFDEKGWLVLGFCGHQPMIADQYTSTGSLYMATLGFLPLGLPADNVFWTGPTTDWTSKKAWSSQPFKKDYKVEY
ncbi:hypothetical protein BD847_0796 [Flavobacterium cutihirudinis]|uniref:DUF2264 domain-containing protein n=1 Tax=Flavobacterium cutihirudinis TaxID=1265740 RepID=A0A3D9G0V3_9FLAO|nr:DUF2264 domain-containing protein [Flavobacterium cutihirudinis]RED26870.1 hypothetical protein BD847_0796 [Flavobacterium cutihirudinis]